MNEKLQLWAADPHEYGPGKIHSIDPDNSEKTYCGRFVNAIPGKLIESGKPTCQSCLQGPLRREERNRFSKEWEEKWAIHEQEQAQKTNEWWQRYNAYLKSEHWKTVRAFVLKRDRVCQKCFKTWCEQAHHLSYETFNKYGFSFPAECVGICADCHETIHEQSIAVLTETNLNGGRSLTRSGA